VDVTRVGLAALTTVGFALFWLARLARAGRGPTGTAASNGGRPSLADVVRVLRR
jgi:hypothetical protein